MRVAVIGAGYAGVMAANRLLKKRPDLEVVVVNPRSDFVERVRLHQLVSESGSATRPLAEILDAKVQLRVASVRRIDVERQSLELSEGKAVDYDYLVYAVGSGRKSSPIPGSDDHAFSVSDFDQAQLLRMRLNALPRPTTVTVIGGGLTGIETAAELAESDSSVTVTLVSDTDVAQHLPARSRRTVVKRLRLLGVAVIENAAVAAVEDEKVVLADGRVIASDTTVNTASFGVPALARISGLDVDPIGRLRVDATLRCPSHQEIIGAGDAMVGPEETMGHVRMSCQAALPLGAHAADTVLASIDGLLAEELSLGFMLQCISIGRKDAVVHPTKADDTPNLFPVTGRAGALIKEQICAGTIPWMAKGSYSWARSGPR